MSKYANPFFHVKNIPSDLRPVHPIDRRTLETIGHTPESINRIKKEIGKLIDQQNRICKVINKLCTVMGYFQEKGIISFDGDGEIDKG